MARKDANPGKREEAAERRVRALRLRQRGLGYVAIAKCLDISLAQAWRDVSEALEALGELEEQEAQTLRQLVCLRLDQYLARLDGQIRKGDTKAILAAVKIE